MAAISHSFHVALLLFNILLVPYPPCRIYPVSRRARVACDVPHGGILSRPHLLTALSVCPCWRRAQAGLSSSVSEEV